MQPDLVDPAIVARRVAELYSNKKTRRMPKCIRISRSDFRTLAGRERLDGGILEQIIDELVDEYSLYLIPMGKRDFAIFDASSFENFLSVARKEIRQAIRSANGIGYTTLSPQAAWPFPTESRP